MHCSTRVKRLTAGGGRGKEQSSEVLALLVRVLVAGPTISVMPATMLPQMRVPMEHGTAKDMKQSGTAFIDIARIIILKMILGARFAP